MKIIPIRMSKETHLKLKIYAVTNELNLANALAKLLEVAESVQSNKASN